MMMVRDTGIASEMLN